MKFLAKPVNFLKEVRAQLIKVAWPTRPELVGATIAVIMITVLIAVFIWIIDSGFTYTWTWIFK